MFSSIIERFAQKSPVTLVVQLLLEKLLDSNKINQWFKSTADVQYTRKILFSDIVSIMLKVVCRVEDNVHLAYLDSGIKCSRVALYDKLKNTELKVSKEIVTYIATQAEEIIEEIKGQMPNLLPGFKVLYLDGNCLASTERRLKGLRDVKAAALPSKSLVAFDQALGIVCNVFPCENGHAQERSLFNEVLLSIKPDELWVADRNFCTKGFLFGIQEKQAFFIIRKHGQTRCNPLSEQRFVGYSPRGKVYEQLVYINHEKQIMKLRLITVKLKKATRNNDQELYLLTNLPNETNASKITYIYKKRWTIETAFQKLEKYLNSEINTLAYPKAALFGFCISLVAFNVYAIVMALLRATYPDKNIDEEISDYYLAKEISSNYGGITHIIEENEWKHLVENDIPRFVIILLSITKNINLKKFAKHKRGPKKKPIPRTRFVGKSHVSTFKILSLNKNTQP